MTSASSFAIRPAVATDLPAILSFIRDGADTPELAPAWLV
jgi:hypothetical protein